MKEQGLIRLVDDKETMEHGLIANKRQNNTTLWRQRHAHSNFHYLFPREKGKTVFTLPDIQSRKRRTCEKLALQESNIICQDEGKAWREKVAPAPVHVDIRGPK